MARRKQRQRPAPDRPRDPGRRQALKALSTAAALAALGELGFFTSCARRAAGRAGKVIVLGLDGIDPGHVERLIKAGALPNIKRLAGPAGLHRLTSSIPPQSPVAWANFITGRDPGGHGIFDFVLRDPDSYEPYFSIARTHDPQRVLSLGDWRLPLSSAKVTPGRKAPAFWDALGGADVPADIYRLPSNFPPSDAPHVRQLAGLGAPDLHGTYGVFTYYTDLAPPNADDVEGGVIYQVPIVRGRADCVLTGPRNTLRKDHPLVEVPFTVFLDPQHPVAKIAVQSQEFLLRQGEWTPWVRVRFPLAGKARQVSGICRFFLKEVHPRFGLYVTPVNIDPAHPALPIAQPEDFSQELAHRFGRFYTQGFPEDTKALTAGVLDDSEYLRQSDLAFGEHRRMYRSALDDLEQGLLVYYFSTSDRRQHMFWRTMDPRHPAYDPKVARHYGSAIPDFYRTADALVGETLDAVDGDTTLIVLSDHGFGPFYRSFDINGWLLLNGYLKLLPRSEGADTPFERVDWGNTRAYAPGLNGIYVNTRGREVEGCVTLGTERDRLVEDLRARLLALRDPKTGAQVIRQVHRADQVHSGPFVAEGPDLIVGYNRGYRFDKRSEPGRIPDQVIADNLDPWSGDHCIDRDLVPGILLANRPIRARAPSLADLGPSVLSLFGLQPSKGMTGRSIF